MSEEFLEEKIATIIIRFFFWRYYKIENLRCRLIPPTHTDASMKIMKINNFKYSFFGI